MTSLVSWGLTPDPGIPDGLVQKIIIRQALIAANLGASLRFNEFRDQDQDPVLLELLQRLPCAVALRSATERFDAVVPPAVSATAPPPQFPLAAFSATGSDSVQERLLRDLRSGVPFVVALQGALHASGISSAPTGVYSAVQGYAAQFWQSVWGTFPAGTTDAQWAAMNASIATLMAPLRVLEAEAFPDSSQVDRVLAAAVEALSCRVDAWATSVATARLRAGRLSTPTGLHVGMYGWLVDVEPEAPEQRSTDNGWVLAPSPQQAVSAAVVLAGAQAHSETAFDIDLRSDRVRRALAVLSGLRAGSTLEELLGYQLERALHDNQLDQFIAPLRAKYPLPLADIGDPAGQAAAQAAHGARLIVDGDQVRREDPRANVTTFLAIVAPNNPVAPTPGQDALIVELIDDLDVTVNAVADLLLAEGVHHLVGGSPLRAALAVDTIGKATAVPDRFDVIATPTRAVSVVHTAGLAVTVAADSAWSDSPRSALDPAAEAVARWALGDPADWQVTVTEEASGPQKVALADLGAGAIDIAVEVTEPLDGSALAARVRAHTATGGVVRIVRSDSQGGPDAVVALASAVRTVLGRCRSVDNPMQALDAAAANPIAVDLPGLAQRASSWWGAVRAAVDAFAPGGTADPGQAITELARLGFADVRFDTAVSAGAQLYSRVLAIETALRAQWENSVTDLAGPAPAVDGPDADGWRSNLTRQLRATAGQWCTAAPLFAASDSGWTMLAGQPPTAPDHDSDAVGDWVRDYSQIQSGISALADLLSITGACGAANPPDWLVLQHRADGPPDGPAPPDEWVARSHPGTRSAAALTALQIGEPAAGAGLALPSRALLMVDQWVETVPAAPVPDPSAPDPTTAEVFAAQQAALTFRFDSPDSRAPQTVLLVAAPDPQRGWRADDIHAAVEETLWWAMARPLDADDTPEQELQY